MHNDLRTFPYKVQIARQHFPSDFGERIEFRNVSQQLLHANYEVLYNLITLGKAHFHLCGVFNKQNYHFRDSEQPSLLH